MPNAIASALLSNPGTGKKNPFLYHDQQNRPMIYGSPFITADTDRGMDADALAKIVKEMFGIRDRWGDVPTYPPLTTKQSEYWTNAPTRTFTVGGEKRGETWAKKTMGNMYPPRLGYKAFAITSQEAKRQKLDEGYDWSYYDPQARAVNVRPGAVGNYGTLAHEFTHLQQMPGSQVYPEPYSYSNMPQAAEYPAAISSGIVNNAMTAVRRSPKVTPGTLPLRESLAPVEPGMHMNFASGYSPSVDWLRQQAEQHGVFSGDRTKTVTRLMSQNPQFVRLLTEKAPWRTRQ